ncbi:hypothetical protein JTB14_021735 [Gonioctena quinquepunctata]|nr:hypothetical protein JTB14_021735 [Gonioctena quinquepunctata]
MEQKIYNNKAWNRKDTPDCPDLKRNADKMEDDNYERLIGETYTYLRTMLTRKASNTKRSKDITTKNIVKKKELNYILRKCARVMLWMQDVTMAK